MQSRFPRNPKPAPGLKEEDYALKVYGPMARERVKWRCRVCHRGNDHPLPRPIAPTEIRACAHCHKTTYFRFRLKPIDPPPARAEAPKDGA